MSLSIAAAVPAANLISVVLFTAVHTPKNVPFDVYISLFFTSASVAAVPSTVNTASPSVADKVLSLLTIPVLVKSNVSTIEKAIAFEDVVEYTNDKSYH